VEKFKTDAQMFLKLFPLQESVVDCDKDCNLQLFLDKAAKRGKTQEEKRWLIKNAKRLITLWGEEKGSVSLHDYAAREYGDMLRCFYKPRWQKYIKTLFCALQEGKAYEEYERYTDEIAFVCENKEYNRENNTDLFSVATIVLKNV
jgi:alpha-N-acetylglucosaminidase